MLNVQIRKNLEVILSEPFSPTDTLPRLGQEYFIFTLIVHKKIWS